MVNSQEWLIETYPNKKTTERIILWARLETNLLISDYPNLKKIDTPYDYYINIPNLEIKSCPQLQEIRVSCFRMQNLVIVNCSQVRFLDLSHNNLTNIDRVINQLPNLETLWANENNLNSLDISNNPKLRILECDSNLQHVRQLVEKNTANKREERETEIKIEKLESGERTEAVIEKNIL